jgi:GH15 family glucan-1,4-alpha-glucosidase
LPSQRRSCRAAGRSPLDAGPLAGALVEIGDLDQARKLCERLLAYASPFELYAEEIDTYSGRHLGNFPQASTHLALINAVMHVIRAESGGGPPSS